MEALRRKLAIAACVLCAFALGQATAPTETKTRTVRLIEPGVLVPKPDGTHELIPLHELEGATQQPGAPDVPR